LITTVVFMLLNVVNCPLARNRPILGYLEIRARHNVSEAPRPKRQRESPRRVVQAEGDLCFAGGLHRIIRPPRCARVTSVYRFG